MLDAPGRRGPAPDTFGLRIEAMLSRKAVAFWRLVPLTIAYFFAGKFGLSLAFDAQKNLWVQQYVDLNNPTPGGPDHVLKIDKAIVTATPEDMASVPVTFYQVPTADSVMHRIIQGPDGNMWFTELHTNIVGKLRIDVTAQ